MKRPWNYLDRYGVVHHKDPKILTQWTLCERQFTSAQYGKTVETDAPVTCLLCLRDG